MPPSSAGRYAYISSRTVCTRLARVELTSIPAPVPSTAPISGVRRALTADQTPTSRLLRIRVLLRSERSPEGSCVRVNGQPLIIVGRARPADWRGIELEDDSDVEAILWCTRAAHGEIVAALLASDRIRSMRIGNA